VSTSGSYHHGNVTQATLDAARSMLDRLPAQDISLREVARSAGLSHAAPYRHFPERAQFLVALAERCLTELVSAQRAALAAHTDSADRLVALGAGYVAYGAANPHAFALIFDPTVAPPHAPPPRLASLIGEHSAMLAGCVADALSTGRLAPTAGPDTIAMALWGLVHGLTHLVIAGLVPADEVVRILRTQLTE
jgi:AcrR family transcriptional regulator